MSEIFSEVDEEVRREQLKKLWDKYAFLVIGAAFLIVAAVGGWRGYQYYQDKRASEAGSQYEAAVALVEQNKTAEADAALAKVGSEGTPAYRALARLWAAAETAKRDPAAGIKLYDALAADTSLDATQRDLATIRAASLQIDTAPYDVLRQRLEPLTTASRTFRHSARDMLALSAWRNNDASATRQWLDLLTSDTETPASIRSRAEALQALLPPAARS